MIPKPKRLCDRQAIENARMPHCELCGRTDLGLHVHHVITRGAGGGDHPRNLVCLCADCHMRVHAGRIPREKLWAIISRRERISPAAVEAAARERGYASGSHRERALNLTREYVEQLRIAEGRCPTCGNDMCSCKLFGGRELAEGGERSERAREIGARSCSPTTGTAGNREEDAGEPA